MIKTGTKQRISTIEEQKNKPVELVIKLSNTLKSTDEEIKTLRKKIRDLNADKYENEILVKGLTNRIKELEKIKADYEKMLKDLGAKEEIIKSTNEELNNICNTASKTLKDYKTNNNEMLNEFSTEELEEMNKKALKKLDNILKNL